jgi:hypothetical protein
MDQLVVLTYIQVHRLALSFRLVNRRGRILRVDGLFDSRTEIHKSCTVSQLEATGRSLTGVVPRSAATASLSLPVMKADIPDLEPVGGDCTADSWGLEALLCVSMSSTAFCKPPVEENLLS